jgi:heat shock protein HslJ
VKTLSTSQRNRIPLLALSIMLLVTMTGCGEGDGATDDPLEGSRWEVIAVRGGTNLVAAHPTTIATAVFSDGLVSGSTGCNLYQAPYSLDADAITFGDLAQTGFACDPNYVGQGDAFIQAIRVSTRFILTTEGLELADASGATQVLFRPTTELPLTWVDWQLMWYGGGNSLLDGTQISLAFRDDGTLIGVAGCNSYSAEYEIDGDQLVIGPIAQTEMACIPDGVMTQETDYLAILRGVKAFSTTLTGLELLDGDGNPVAEYRFGGRIRHDRSDAADGDLAETAFVGLTRDAAIRLAVDQGRLWRISRQDDEFFAHDAQLVIGRVTLEIDDGNVTSASIERDTPPGSGDDIVEDPTRADLIADAVKRLLSVDNSFDRADVFDDIRIATVIGSDPARPLQSLDLELIAGMVSELGKVKYIDDADTEIEALFDESPAGVAVVSVERVNILDDHAEVELRLWCGQLCGVFLTYEAESQNGEWNITGTTGPIAMS